MSLSEKSPIQNFYTDTNIFITGVSGFLGTALLEKLIRSCPDIKKIYVLMREKANRTSEQRLDEIFDDQLLWDKVKKQNPKFKNYIKLIDGELMSSKLGISDENYTKLSNEVNIIFHVAATVRFDEPLKRAAKINIEATKNILELAKKCGNLKAVVYVSTAFSQCVRPTLKEIFYEPQRDPDEFLAYCDKFSEEELNKQTLSILGNYPNTYTFTKSLSENLLKKYENQLPLGLCRPSAVTGCAEEPIEGWYKGQTGLVGVMMAMVKGLLRVMPCSLDAIVDLIPVDMCVNQIIAIAYEVSKNQKKTKIYNCVTGSDNPITWREFWKWSISFGQIYACHQSILYYFIFFLKERNLLEMYQLLFHTIPAHFKDFSLGLSGKEPKLVKDYNRLHKLTRLIFYFCVTPWVFYSENSRKLYESLMPNDQRIFPFDVRKIEWDKYLMRTNKYIQMNLLKNIRLQHKI